jgi:TolB-like protein/DNA-binding winged helix-turn-helix (wHTH) protein/Tfp pilus assembly protein PilF
LAETPQIIRFSVYEVDLKAGELRKNGIKIKLQQQPFQLLTILLRKAGEVVAREELRKELWPEDTFVDFEHSVNAAIARLRDALGESADRPVFIETLARRGYRFNTPLVSPSTASATEVQNPAPAPPEPSTLPYLGRRAAALASVLLVAIVVWGALAKRGASRAQRIESIAVLPLENLSRDPAQEYFSDGMTSAIIGTISDMVPLRVISRTSTERYKGTKKSLPDIAKELGVDAVIEGSVLRAGNRVRIDVELIDGSTDKHLWSESYERELGDVLKVHSEIAKAIANRVQIQVAARPPVSPRTTPVVNQMAYDDYLKARRYMSGAERYPQLVTAQQYYQKSIQEDPDFALPYVGLADTYLALGMTRRLATEEARAKGRENIEKALRIDPSLRETSVPLGDLSWQYEWDWPKAEAEYLKAIAANPSDMEAHEAYAWFLSWSGRRDDASAEIALMRKLDPAFPLRCNDEAGLHYHLREYEELMKSAQQGIALDPSDWASHYFLGVGEYGSKKKADAIAEFQKAVQLSSNDQDALAALAFAYASIGKRSEAQKIFEDLQHESAERYVSPYMLAVISAGLGDRAKSFAYLQMAYAQKSTDLAYFIKADFRLDELRSDARFANLIARVAPPGMEH